MKSVTVTVPVTRMHTMFQLNDLLQNAFDTTFSRYWVNSAELTDDGYNVSHHSESEADIDTDMEFNTTSLVDAAAMERGIQAMADKYPSHYANVGTTRCDAETADVYLQCCIFGDCLFG